MKLQTFLDRIATDPAYEVKMRRGPWTTTEIALLLDAAPRGDPQLRRLAQEVSQIVMARRAYELQQMIHLRLEGDETLTVLQRHRLENVVRALDDAFAGEIMGMEKIDDCR